MIDILTVFAAMIALAFAGVAILIAIGNSYRIDQLERCIDKEREQKRSPMHEQ